MIHPSPRAGPLRSPALRRAGLASAVVERAAVRTEPVNDRRALGVTVDAF